MGELGGFLKWERGRVPQRDPRERIGDYREFLLAAPDPELRRQGGRLALVAAYPSDPSLN